MTRIQTHLYKGIEYKLRSSRELTSYHFLYPQPKGLLTSIHNGTFIKSDWPPLTEYGIAGKDISSTDAEKHIDELTKVEADDEKN